VSDYTNRALFANPSNPDDIRVGAFEPIRSYPGHYFDLQEQQGQGLRAGQFRLHAPSSDGLIFSRLHMRPELGCIKNSNIIYDDQWFTFKLERLNFVGVEYDVRNAQINSIQPKSIFSQTSKNDSNVKQKPAITIRETTEQQSTFETEAGLEVGITSSFLCGVPTLAEGKVEVSAKVHTNLTWGKTNTTSQSWEASVPLTVPPKTHMRVTATVTQLVIELPFTTTWKFPKTGKTMTTKGTFKGLSSSDLTTNFLSVEQ
jgi:hypothetical protein